MILYFFFQASYSVEFPFSIVLSLIPGLSLLLIFFFLYISLYNSNNSSLLLLRPLPLLLPIYILLLLLLRPPGLFIGGFKVCDKQKLKHVNFHDLQNLWTRVLKGNGGEIIIKLSVGALRNSYTIFSLESELHSTETRYMHNMMDGLIKRFSSNLFNELLKVLLVQIKCLLYMCIIMH